MKINFLKLGLLVLLTLFTFSSCNKEEEVIESTSTIQERGGIKVQTKNNLEDKELEHQIDQNLSRIKQIFEVAPPKTLKKNYKNSKGNDSINLQDIAINTEVFIAIENEIGKTSYTFEVNFPTNDDNQEIINLHSYYDENDHLKNTLLKYELTNEELRSVIKNQSFDGFWDKVFYLDMESVDTTTTSKRSLANKSGDPCSCPGGGGATTVIWQAFPSYSNNSGYGGSSPGVSYALPASALSSPQVYAALAQAGVIMGYGYDGATTMNYTFPVIYFSANDLSIPSSSTTGSATPFSNLNNYYPFYGLKDLIKNYYEQVYVPEINNYITSSQTLMEDHLKKQETINAFFEFTYELQQNSIPEFNYLKTNQNLTRDIFYFFAENGASNEAKEFANASIEILSLPIIISSNQLDYKAQILRLTNHLKQFGNIEDEIYAEYIESLLPEFENMSIGEVNDIYLQVKQTCNDLTIKYFFAIATPVVTDLIIPVVTYALLEATAGTAIKLLQRIPVSMVLRGVRLNKMVLKLTQLGVPGVQANVRVINTGAPISKARELFLSITKNAESVTQVSPNVTKAAMGNGNFIIYRTVSSSGFPATIEFNFVELLGTNSFKLKFGL